MVARSWAQRSVNGVSPHQLGGKLPDRAAPANEIHHDALHCIGGHEAADDDGAAMVDVPHHGPADRVAAVADDGAFGHCHPLSLDRYPIGAVAHVIVRAMTVGDVAAGHAVRRDHALEPSADVGRDVIILPVVERKRRARQRRHRSQPNAQCEPAHAILLIACRANGARSLRASIRVADAIKPELSAHCMLK
ncbi:hypothetical protein DXU04_19270 [Bradyrhizobium diazoefficiens]|nr:hypothetical protein CO678_11550 [Bradyrhizobium diazoefficiens]